MRKTKKEIKKEVLNYTIIFKPAKESGLTIYIPSSPNYHIQEEILDNTYHITKDAIYGYIKTLQELEAANR